MPLQIPLKVYERPFLQPTYLPVNFYTMYISFYYATCSEYWILVTNDMYIADDEDNQVKLFILFDGEQPLECFCL